MLNYNDPALNARFDREYREEPIGYYRGLALSALGFYLLMSAYGFFFGFPINREGIQLLNWGATIPITAVACGALFTPGLTRYTRQIVIIYALAITAVFAIYPRFQGEISYAYTWGFAPVAFTVFLVLSFARLHAIQALLYLVSALALYSAVLASLIGIGTLSEHLAIMTGPAALGFAVGHFGERTARTLFAARLEVEDRERLLRTSEEKLRDEKEKTDALVLNMLPESIAVRLKDEGRQIADGIAECTVLFSDLVGFTSIAESTGPRELVRLLNELFSHFDELCGQHKLEKIKTIGDAYMAAAGVPDYLEAHPTAAANMALDMVAGLAEFNDARDVELGLRIGIHSGPVVAGIIGTKKFTYDLWGDTVNMAARMESHGTPGKIQVSESTARLLRRTHILEERGEIEIKGKGKIVTFWLMGPKE